MAAALRQVQVELTSAPPTPSVTLVEEFTAEPAAPAPLTGSQTQPQSTQVSQAGPPQAASPVADLEQPVEKRVPKETIPEEPVEAGPASDALAVPKAGLIARLGIRRILLAVGGVLALGVVVVAVIMFLNARKPPVLQLMPISRPTNLINVQTAPAVVSLGRWETGSYIERLAFSPDSGLLATANNRDWVRFSTYRFYSGLWQVEPGSLKDYALGHTQWVSDVAFAPDGSLYGSVSDDGSLLLWQVADGLLAHNIESTHGGLTSIAFSPDGKLLAAGSWDGVAELWQVSNGNLLRTFQENDYALEDVSFSPDGKLLAAASDENAILLWQVGDGRLARNLQDQTGPVHQVIFSPDGSLLASASEDHTIKIWQVSDGSLLHTLPAQTEAINDIAFSADGSVLASGSDDGLLGLWQVSDGSLLTTLIEYSDSIRSVAFSPDGFLLVSAAGDGVIQFWGISQAIPLETK
jgi:WD40 repeat protein